MSRSTQNNLEFNPISFLCSLPPLQSPHFTLPLQLLSPLLLIIDTLALSMRRHLVWFILKTPVYLTYLSMSVSCSVPLQFFSILASPVQFCMLYLFYPLPVCLIKKLLLAHTLVNLSFRYLCFLPPFTFNS